MPRVNFISVWTAIILVITFSPMALSFDPVANFAYSTVLTPPSPSTSGTTLVLAPGTGVLFQVNMNCVDWPNQGRPLLVNAEIVRITGITGDTLTILRAQEGTTPRAILAGDQFSNNLTKKMITDLEAAIEAGGGGGSPNLDGGEAGSSYAAVSPIDGGNA